VVQHVQPPVVVLAIPRGGVIVGARVADRLGAPLDVVVPRKIGAPGNPELAIGAVAEGVEAIDRRAAGGALWAVGGAELAELMARLGEQGFRFKLAEKGGRATGHRPAWWIK
jgi:predicted phosphoribosyltransferase